MRSTSTLAAAMALGLASAACDREDPARATPIPLADPVRVSGASPFAAGCNAVSQGGVRYAGSEVEPSLTVNPVNPDHLVAAWQQDRWSSGGSDGLATAMSLDGGITWTRAVVPFSLCGGGAGRGGGFQRATDPWVSFSADGNIVHLIGFAFDATTARAAILATRSTDGGLHWQDPAALATTANPDIALDKPTLTADPVDPQRVYAVWDRLTGVTSPDESVVTGPAWFSSSSDGGATWSEAAILYDPGSNAQTIASQIVVLPGGALVNVLVRITCLSTNDPRCTGTTHPLFELVALRSEDGGASWSVPGAVISELRARGAQDPKTGHAVRAGEVVPFTAVDGATGQLYVVWEDARFSGGARDGIVIATSVDGGLDFSAPAQVNGSPSAEAFRPAVAVGKGGAIAVTYYDFRNDPAADPDHTWTSFWRATSPDFGGTWHEAPEGGPFDLRTTPDAEGWFVGDYTGLVASGDRFIALFGMGGDSTDVFVSR